MTLKINKINKIIEYYKQGLSIRDISKLTGIDKNTVLKSTKWDGTINLDRKVSSGVYVYKLYTGNINTNIQNKKMLLY